MTKLYAKKEEFFSDTEFEPLDIMHLMLHSPTFDALWPQASKD